MAVTPRMWEALCAAIGREDLLADPRFADPRARQNNRKALEDAIAAWTAGRSKYEAMQVLAEAGVPASAVLDTQDLYQNPHMVSRGFIHEVDHPEKGKVRLLGWPTRMSASKVPIKTAPALGEHSAEVLAEDLALDKARIAELMEAGVVGG